jgi:hypothetical protein
VASLLTQTLKFRFLYVTDSTLKPIVGIVVTTSPIYFPSISIDSFRGWVEGRPSVCITVWSCRRYPAVATISKLLFWENGR